MKKSNDEKELTRIAIDIHHKSLMTYLAVLISITVLQFAIFSLLIQRVFIVTGIVKVATFGIVVVLYGFLLYLILELYSTYVEIMHLREKLGVNIILKQLRQELGKKSRILRIFYKFRRHHWESDETGVHIGKLPIFVLIIMLIITVMACCFTLSIILFGYNPTRNFGLLQLIEEMDYDLFFIINQVENPSLNSLFVFFSFLCSYFPYLLITAILWVRHPKLGTLLLIGLGIVSAFLFVTKLIVLRPRPPQVLSNVKVLGSFEGSSFPSGHSTRAFLLTSIVGSSYSKAVMPLFIFASLVAVSRVYVGAHFPTDIIVGSMLGVVCGRVLYSYQNVFSPLFEISGWVQSKFPFFGRSLMMKERGVSPTKK